MKCLAEQGVFARASRMGRRLIATTVLHGFCCVVFLVIASGAYGAEAKRVLIILTGSDVKTLPLEIRTDSIPTFNWPALQRWGIPESRLPPNSIVRFRPQSLWEAYRWP